MSDEPWVLAIDFGTSFTVAASRVGDRPPEVIEIGGERRLPSIIVVDTDGAVHVGRAAETAAPSSPGRVLRAPKSRLGEPAPVVLGGRPHPITSLVADLLRHVHQEAIRYHGREPEEVRLTHPATWSGPRRQQLVAAAELAGIEHPVLVPEPVAAAIAYADEGGASAHGHVLVYDLGGGTFDTAALQASPEGFVVIGRPGGDPRLGGELFDELLANAIGERLDRDVFEQLQVAEDVLWQQAAAGLLRESRRVKEALSSHPYADVLLGLPTGLVQQRVGQDDLTRVIGPYVDETVAVMRQTAEGAGLADDEWSSIYLVGGASRTPLVAESVGAAFPGIPLSQRGDPKGVVALGATHPRATPTSLAQRSSLDRATTLERPGPPLPVVVVAPTAPDADDLTETTAPAPLPPHAAAPLASPVASPAASPVGPSRRDRRPLVLGAVAAGAVALLVGGIALATRAGDGDTAVATTTVTSVAPTTIEPADAPTTVAESTTAPPTSAETEPATTTAVTTATTTTAAPAPTTTVARPPKTLPTITESGGPTEAQLRESLITAADLTNGTWQEIEYVEGAPFCGETTDAGTVAEVVRQFQLAGATFQVIAQSATTYATEADATAAFTTAYDAFENCPNATSDVNGVTYTLLTTVTRLTPVEVPLPCYDQAAIITVTLTDADSPVPFLGQYMTAIRCGVNVTVVAVATDVLSADPPPDFVIATTAAAMRIATLPGSAN